MRHALRLLAAALLVGLSRAVALAAVAMALSRVEPEARAAFLLTWTAVFGLAVVPATLVEGFLLTGVATIRAANAVHAPAGVSAPIALSAPGTALAALSTSALLWLTLAHLAQAFRCLGLGGGVALGFAGAVGWALVLPRTLGGRAAPGAADGPEPGGGSVAGRPRPPRGSLAASLAPAILALAILGAALLADPEGRYGERYAESRLSPAFTAGAPGPAAGREPATLSDVETARALATTWMRTHPPERTRWLWEEAVAVEGLLAYGRASGDPQPFVWARAWVDARAPEALSLPSWADTCAPAIAVLALRDAGRGHPAVDDPILARVDRHVLETGPRTRRGVISHVGDLLGGALPAQAWVDTLFMHGVYLHRRAREAQDVSRAALLLDEAARLGEGMLDSLEDPAAHLLRHARVDLGPLEVPFPAERTFWARGNAWALAFLVDHQRARDALRLARHAGLEERTRAFADALLPAQDAASGLWRTDLLGPPPLATNRGDDPLESSASALFASALRQGARAGVAGMDAREEAAAARAIAGVRGRLRWVNGWAALEGTTTGTHPGFRAYYRAVPQDENVGHGVGAALLGLTAGE